MLAACADGSRKAYLFDDNSDEQQTSPNINKNTPIRATAFILDPLPDDEDQRAPIERLESLEKSLNAYNYPTKNC